MQDMAPTIKQTERKETQIYSMPIAELHFFLCASLQTYRKIAVMLFKLCVFACMYACHENIQKNNLKTV